MSKPTANYLDTSNARGPSDNEAEHLDLGFQLVIKRSVRRRTLEIVIREGKVFLMTPQFISEADGVDFVNSKRDWILKTLNKQQTLLAETPVKRYQAGETFDYLGEAYPLRVFSASRATVMLNEDGLHVGFRRSLHGDDEAKIRKALHGWYKQRALDILADKSHSLAEKIGKKVSDVKVRATKTKWGHCTSDGVLQFNWYIMAAPEWVVDYLVAHEVSHLTHRHHRASFWRQVELLCPNVSDAKNWLKQNSHRIVF